MIESKGQCPRSDGKMVEWKNFLTEIIKESFANLHLVSEDLTYAWRSNGTTSK